MSIYSDILKKYWGYDSFRPLQEDIIRSVADFGKDTLGLLPTGGGKSIIFQVPALAKEGVCIVITPLIALMKDQVENLKQRNIRAVAVYSGMTQQEIVSAFDSCILGSTKFLYLSPERLFTPLFIEKIKQINVNILAVDEAHCISQWGYDFRPSYLKIAEIRQLLPNVPILALTATATKEVAEDIQDKLLFKEKNLFQKSFERKNLIYIVRNVDDKDNYMLRILNSQLGTGIVYVRNRKRTKEAAEFLQSKNISADYFHAGITQEWKNFRQEQWKKGNIRVICATNAFGMGIDKPDVRVVVHLDLPDSIEGYFQEAGRAGRDEKKSYAVLLYNQNDISNLKRNLTNSFPEKKYIRQVYKALGEYYQLAFGVGEGGVFPFRLYDFATRFNFNQVQVFSALKILQRNGYIETTDENTTKAKFKFLVDRQDLYKFQVKNTAFDYFIKILLRGFEGVFSDYVEIDEDMIARREKCKVEVIYGYMNKLSSQNIISYIPKKTTPYLIFSQARIDEKNLIIKPETYELLKEKYQARINAMIKYCLNSEVCRSKQLISYFGQESEDCGECDVCRSKKERVGNYYDFDKIFDEVYNILKQNALTLEEILSYLGEFKSDFAKNVIMKMVNDGVIFLQDDGKLYLNDN